MLCCVVLCSVCCGMRMWMWTDCVFVMAAYERSEKNEREREFIFIFIFRGFGVANLFGMFAKYKAFHWTRVHLPTMCGLTVAVKK